MSLGTLEKRILNILLVEQEMTSKAMLAEFKIPVPALSTLSLTLRMMENKGLITHTKVGKIYFYASVVDKTGYLVKQVKAFANENFDGNLQKMITFLYSIEKM